MNPKAIGELTEAIVIAKLIELGYGISIPFGNNLRYDMIADDGTRLWRIQCKTGRLRNGSVEANVASVNGFTGSRQTYHNQADVIVVYCPANQGLYWIPVAETGRSSIKLRIDPPHPNTVSRMRWAVDYAPKPVVRS